MVKDMKKNFVVTLFFMLSTSSFVFTSQFKTGVDLVEVDVTVMDKDGRPVTDLTAADFEIRERGVAQRIDTIYLVTGDPALLRQTPQPSGAEPFPAGASVPRRALQPRVFVFVLDVAHLTPAGFDRTRTAIRSFLNEGLRPTDLAGLVVNGEMLGNRIVSDKAALLALLDRIGPPTGARYNEMRTWPRILTEEEAARIARSDEPVVQQAVLRACNERPGDCTGNGRFAVETEIESKSRLIASESARDAQTALAVLLTLANGLGKFPGPKHVVLFSEGFYTGDFSERVTQVAGLAARNSVRISTLDARGLARDVRQQDLLGEAPVVSTTDFGAVLGFDENADVLTTLALDTGGQRVRDRNNLRPALDAIALETGTYYLLGYSARDAFDGSYRKIDVSVKRPGLTVRARRGYLATPQERKTPTDAPAAAPAAAPTPPIATPDRNATPPGSSAAVAIPPAAGAAPPAAAPATGSSAATPAIRLRPDSSPDVAGVANRIADPANTTSARAAALGQEGWNLYAAGKVEGARDKLAEASTAGGGPWVDYALGYAEFALQHFDAAVTAWQRVRTSRPDHRPVYFDLADAYLQQGKSTEALAVLRDAAGRWPDDNDAHNAVGIVLLRRGDLDGAINSFSRAVNAAPTDEIGHFNLGSAYHQRYVRRLQSAGSSSAARQSVADRDRQSALDAYRACAALEGQYASRAREAIAVLEWRN
jgi:VWFA-related protein